MRIEFIKDYEISKLVPADYNPRKLEEDKFALLQESIKKFGVIKPLIVNGDNGILTAGHQRTRAMKAVGIKTAPVIRICGIKVQDEIRFNLFHNSIETNKSKVKIKGFDLKAGEYSIIPSECFEFETNENATVVKEIGRLILRYGEWGSIVADEDGNVILNSDYAVASKQLRADVICYVIDNKSKKELLEYLSVEYGVYNYETLGIKSYNQLYCQMNRLNSGSKRQMKSSLYEQFVIPKINKEMRVLDFGAGRCAYVDLLSRQGYKILAYEPNFQNGKRNIDIGKVVSFIKAIEKDVKENGLFDVVVLDSVLNSVVNSEVENLVITTCNSFLKENGKLYIGTRNLEQREGIANLKYTNDNSRGLDFLDNENFTATFRDGVWTMQHFHTQKTLEDLLSKYFNKIQTFGTKNSSNIYAIAEKPKAIELDEALKALEFELNMEYPRGYKHNAHNGLMQILKEKLVERNDKITNA